MKNYKNTSTIAFGAALASYLMWGLFPIYWKRLSSVDAFQVLSHRIIWSAIFTVLALVLTKNIGKVFILIKNNKNFLLALFASALITVNWGIYIWAVHNNHIVQSSLGYYINPLISVALGTLFFKEKLDKWLILAVSIALIGIISSSIFLKAIPWVALLLAFSFGFYGVVKKKAGFDPLVGLATETLIAFPFALGYLIFCHFKGISAFGVYSDPWITILLIVAGPVTAIPLLFFALATNKISLTTMGFIQYLSPSLQLFLGLVIYREKTNQAISIAFVTVVIAVAIYFLSRKYVVKLANIDK